MPIKYDYDADSNVIHCRPYGKLTVSEVDEYFQELVKNEQIQNGFLEIVHLKEVEDFLCASSEAQKMVESFRKIKDTKDINGTVFIGESDFHYGIARMFQLFNEVQSSEYSFIVVRSEKRAEAIIKDIKAFIQ